MTAAHSFLHLEVAPGQTSDLGLNFFNSETNVAAAAPASAAVASAACMYYRVLGGARRSTCLNTCSRSSSSLRRNLNVTLESVERGCTSLHYARCVTQYVDEITRTEIVGEQLRLIC